MNTLNKPDTSPTSKATDYFKQAWDAAKLVEDGGKYELHNAKRM